MIAFAKPPVRPRAARLLARPRRESGPPESEWAVCLRLVLLARAPRGRRRVCVRPVGTAAGQAGTNHGNITSSPGRVAHRRRPSSPKRRVGRPRPSPRAAPRARTVLYAVETSDRRRQGGRTRGREASPPRIPREKPRRRLPFHGARAVGPRDAWAAGDGAIHTPHAIRQRQHQCHAPYADAAAGAQRTPTRLGRSGRARSVLRMGPLSTRAHARPPDPRVCACSLLHGPTAGVLGRSMGT